MKSWRDIRKEAENNKEFYQQTLEELRKHNPILADLIEERICKASADEDIRQRIREMSLLALKIVGATDPSDPDFIVVSAGTIKMAEENRLPAGIEDNIPLGTISAVFTVTLHRNFINRVRWNSIWPEVQKILEIYETEIYLEIRRS